MLESIRRISSSADCPRKIVVAVPECPVLAQDAIKHLSQGKPWAMVLWPCGPHSGTERLSSTCCFGNRTRTYGNKRRRNRQVWGNEIRRPRGGHSSGSAEVAGDKSYLREPWHNRVALD